MHATFFRMKRAHHASLRIARRMLDAYDLGPLTPARFDLLFLAHHYRHAYLFQHHLALHLGLDPSTVSKMVTRLAELRLVRREVDDVDRRNRHVAITNAGTILIKQAIRDLLLGNRPSVAVMLAAAPLDWWNPERYERRLRRLNGSLRRYALKFYDSADPLYSAPWVRAAAAAVAVRRASD